MKTKTKTSKRGSKSKPSPRKKEDRGLNSDEQNRITNAPAEEDADDYQTPEYDRNDRDDEAQGKRRSQRDEDDEEN
jgi:hypothetical protein